MLICENCNYTNSRGKSILEMTMTDASMHETRNCTVTTHLVVSQSQNPQSYLLPINELADLISSSSVALNGVIGYDYQHN